MNYNITTFTVRSVSPRSMHKVVDIQGFLDVFLHLIQTNYT